MPSLAALASHDVQHFDSLLRNLTQQAAQLAQHSERLQLLEQNFSEVQRKLCQIDESHCKLAKRLQHEDDNDANLGSQEVFCQSDGHLSQSDGHLSQSDGHLSQMTRGPQDPIPPETPSRSHFLTRESAHGHTYLAYHWHESVWDAALFIATPHLSVGASIVVALCLMFNLGLVLAFVSAVSNKLIRDDFNKHSELEFELWRTTVAHDVSLRNKLTGESLASSVCHKRLSLPFANLQILMVEALSDYLDTHILMSTEFTAGSLMCSLALCVWYLRLGTEVRNVLDVMAACIGIPHGPSTNFEIAGGYHVRLISISSRRIFFMMGIFLLRFAVVIILFVFGTKFLLYETSLTEMLLNSVALELILNLDELVYFSLLPKVPQAMIHRILPLEYRRTRKNWNTFGEMMMLIFVMSATFSIVYISGLKPFVNQLGDNLDALCGGDPTGVDFVVAVDSIGIPWAAATPPSSPLSWTYAQSSVSQAQEVGFPQVPLQPTQRSNRGLFMSVSSPEMLERLQMNSREFKYPKDWTVVDPEYMSEVVGWDKELHVLGPEGRDFGDQPGTVYNHYLRHLLSATGPENVTCADVPFYLCTKHGSSAEDVVMRQLCPSRCGCASPSQGTVSSPCSKNSLFGFMGCAAWNTRRKAFVDTLGELPCMDTQDELVFATWADGVGDARAKGSQGLLIDQLKATFVSGGCPEVVRIDIGGGLSSKLCEESSLSAICPESCGCNATVEYTTAHSWRSDFCPYACNRTTPLCMTVRGNTHNKTPDVLGPLEGYACVFPFTYKGESHSSCTAHDWSQPWCAVTVKEGATLHWGDCPQGC